MPFQARAASADGLHCFKTPAYRDENSAEYSNQIVHLRIPHPPISPSRKQHIFNRVTLKKCGLTTRESTSETASSARGEKRERGKTNEFK